MSGEPAAWYALGLIYEQGLVGARDGRTAAGYYLRAAELGNTLGMYRLALWQDENGYEASAESWMSMAARWNESSAIDWLIKNDKPVPTADLFYKQLNEAQAQKRAQEEAKAARAEEDYSGLAFIGYAIGCALAGGCTTAQLTQAALAAEYYSGPASTGDAPRPANTRASSWVPPPPTKTAAPKRTTSSIAECMSDYGCYPGYTCVKAPLKVFGVCMRASDRFGSPSYPLPRPDSVGPNVNPQCLADYQCPIGFRCDATLQACVK